MGEKKRHAVMISLPYQGHINPFVNLALSLASKAITITFVHLEYIHHQLTLAHHNTDIFSEARVSGLDIRYTTITDGLPLDFDRHSRPEHQWLHLYHNFQHHVDQFVGNLIHQSSDRGDPIPNILVTDTIYAWPVSIAKKYNLVCVSFWTQPALVFSLFYHVDLLRLNGHFQNTDEKEVEMIDYVPGIKAMSRKDLMRWFTTTDDDNVNFTLFTAFEEAKKADFILLNTVYEMESDTLSVLNKYQPTYSIGPINFPTITATVAKSLKAESDCATWLQSKPRRSVLYVSFGSLARTSKHVIQEVAHGLLLSGVHFIWVVRAGLTADSNDADVLPRGFVDGVGDRGLVVPWCDQVTVLSDPGVGVFLTHCGWNSTIESMWCGVPMICYPIGDDQPTNRKLVVDDWRIGINLCDGKYVDRNEVAEKINKCMIGEASAILKQEAENVKKTLGNALQIDGSSTRNFDRFISDLEKKILENYNPSKYAMDC